jgi:hypothetical protein
MWRDGEGKRVPAQIPDFGAFAGQKGHRRRILNRCGENIPSRLAAEAPVIRLVQEFEAIEARAKALTNPREEACRSSERVNSMRRSNALERMKGKRWNTRSRMSR